MVMTPALAIVFSSLRRWIVVAQALRETIGARASVVFQFVTKMIIVRRIFLAGGIGVRGRAVLRKRFDSKRMGGVEIEVLLETVGVEEVVAGPVGGKMGEVARIEIEFYAF